MVSSSTSHSLLPIPLKLTWSWRFLALVIITFTWLGNSSGTGRQAKYAPRTTDASTKYTRTGKGFISTSIIVHSKGKHTNLGAGANIEADVDSGVEGVGLDNLDVTVLWDVVGHMDGVALGIGLVHINNL